MSEKDVITTSKNIVESNKREKREYFDFIMAFINTITIILMFIFINNRILLLYIFGFLFVAVLLIETIITFKNRNPLYIYFCFGLTLNVLLGDIILSFVNPIFIVLFIPIGFYSYSLYESYLTYPIDTRRSCYRQIFYGVGIPIYIASTKNQKQELLEEKMRKNVDKKFKFTSIAFISISCSIGLLITLIISTKI